MPPKIVEKTEGEILPTVPEKREFHVLGGILHDNKFHRIDEDTIALLQDEHAELFEAGLVAPDWDDGF